MEPHQSQRLYPSLEVYAAEFLNSDAVTISEGAKNRGADGIWIIGERDAVAILLKNHPVRQNGSFESDQAARAAAIEMNRLIGNQFEKEGLPKFALTHGGSFPISAFRPQFVFPIKEESIRMVAKSLAKNTSPLGLRLYRSDERAMLLEPKLTELVGKWLEQLSSGGFHGETARTSQPIIRACDVPEMPGFTRQCGYEFIFEDFSEISLSWVELFFLLRRELPKNRRVSLQFWNP